MSGTIILPQDADVTIVKCTLGEVSKLIEKLPINKDQIQEIVDQIGDVTTIDQKFIEEHADDFGFELREIGTKGLSERYVGRHCIHIYGEIPNWMIEMCEKVFRSRYLPCRCKQKEGY